MNLRFIWLLLVLIPVSSLAQISMEDFLLEALGEPSVRAIAEQQSFITIKNFRLAPIQKIEFRTESNQLDPDRQDYALRLNPANPWEVKRNNQYFESYGEMLSLDQDRLVKASLLKRYEVIVDWLYYNEMQQLREEEKLITEKLVAILEGQRFSAYFDANDYVETKLVQVEKTIDLEEARFESDNQRRKIGALSPQSNVSTINWSINSVIALTTLERVVDSVSIQKINGGEVAYREKRIDLATREWQLEKSNVNVGFLQTQYQKFRIEQARKPWNISMGVTIPVFNPNKGDMAKRKLEVIEAQGELDQAKVEQLTRRELAQQKLKSLLYRHREINFMMEELNTGALASSLQQMKDSNPAVVVKLQSKIVKLKVMTARLKKEIYHTYLEFLSYAEVLQQQPLVNYLSPKLQSITK